MRAVLSAIFLAVWLVPALAQQQEEPPPASELLQDARALYVARTLSLRQDQVTKIIALLQQARAVLEARDKALDDWWARSQGSFVSTNQALMAGQQVTQGAAAAVQRATAAHGDVGRQADAALERLAQQFVSVLDKNQMAKVESLREIRAQQQNQVRAQDAGNIPAEMERYVVAMRQLLPEEYESLRVAMALRLASLLVAPDRQGYNNAVADVLRIMDSVRRLTDQQFSDAEPQMRRTIARMLRLPEEPVAQSYPVSFDDLMAFLAYDRTEALLGEYKADPPMEVVP
jgi:hypothetical protein